MYITPKPSIEEVAFLTFEDWWDHRICSLNLDEEKMDRVNCGLVDVFIFDTSWGFLFELWPTNLKEVKGWKYRKDGMYHIALVDNEKFTTDLPSDFKEWFINTIDRMYGWDTENTCTNDTGEERRNTIMGRTAMGEHRP